MYHIILCLDDLRSGELFYPSALSYQSTIYLTIIPTERFPCYSTALPISLALIDPQRYSSSPKLLTLLGNIPVLRGNIHIRSGQFWGATAQQDIWTKESYGRSSTFLRTRGRRVRSGQDRGRVTGVDNREEQPVLTHELAPYAQAQDNSMSSTWRQCLENRHMVSLSPASTKGNVI